MEPPILRGGGGGGSRFVTRRDGVKSQVDLSKLGTWIKKYYN